MVSLKILCGQSLILWSCYFGCHQARAEESAAIIDLPFGDFPFNSKGKGLFIDPSMRQSLQIQKSFTSTLHSGMGLLFSGGNKVEPAWYGKLLISLVDIGLAQKIPGFAGGWTHEEWHRAVMTNRSVSSRDAFFDSLFPTGPVPADHVADEDLARLKKDRPADMVRMSSAGHEALLSLMTAVEYDAFFENVEAWNTAFLWTQVFSAGAMFDYATKLKKTEAATSLPDLFNQSDISKRDFTGIDQTAWVYDMFRPDEPFASRGIHPSGVGIDRYRYVDDLSPEELRFLKSSAKLNLFNMINPMLFGFRSFDISGSKFNAMMKHHITPFGNSIDTNILVNSKDTRLASVLHLYRTPKRWLAGVSSEIRGVRMSHWPLSLTPRFSVWLQPKNLRYDEKGVPGALIGLEQSWSASPNISIYGDVSAKSQGWVQGDVNLESGMSAIMGTRILLR